MKIKTILMLMFMALAVVGSASAKKQKKNEVPEEVKAAIKAQIESGSYVLQVDFMASQGGDMVAVEYGRYLEVIGGVNFRLRTPVLNMEGPMEDYKMVINKKGVMVSTFGANTRDFYYSYNIEIQPDGQVLIKITSNFNYQNQRTELWLYGSVYMPELRTE